MSLMAGELNYRKVRAPQGDGETLIDPPPTQVGEILERNRSLIDEYDIDLQGRPLIRLIREGQSQLVQAATEATRQYRDVDIPAINSPAPIMLAGHQPELFHPGVWYKNFVLSRLASEHRAVPINLVIDSDVATEQSIRVPTESVSDPRLESIPFDRRANEIPFEERSIVDHDCWTSFGQRVLDRIRPLVAHPLIEDFWPLAVTRSKHTDRLGYCLSQARHKLEGQWGAQTLELPQSRVCQLESFHWFTAHLLAHLPRFWEVYNSSVAEYRRVNRVRSSAHPVPDLAADDRWLEAPFWIWSSESPTRRRVFVKQSGDELLLSSRTELDIRLPLTADGDAEAAVHSLRQLGHRGIKLRTRALITTMFARLVLGDLFLHGIGGAKYDQLTDALIERFFGVTAPSYLTVTATLRLPVPRGGETEEDLRRVDALLRNLTYHPETSLNGPGLPREAAAVVESKRRWVQVPQSLENAKARCRAIREANEALQTHVGTARADLLAQREQLLDALHRNGILGSREFSFVLYPVEQLQQRFSAPLE